MLIYLDMDGVLTNCHMTAINYWGVDVEEYPFSTRVIDVIRMHAHPDTLKAPAFQGDNDTFWNWFDHEWWATLPKSNICDRLVKYCEPYDVKILSRPTKNPECWSGKFEWIQTHLPQFEDHVVLSKDKSIASKFGTMLIDDSLYNVAEFEKAGGLGVLVPRRWNGHEEISFNDLMTRIDRKMGVRIA